MRSVRYALIFFLFMMFASGVAEANSIRVFKPMEEDMSSMELRNQALAEGFALAVVDVAQGMLPAPLNETRTELFKKYLMTYGKPYIQGYKVLSSQSTEAGLILSLDVTVNRKSLRAGLKRMGLFQTALKPQVASVTWPEDLTEEQRAEVQDLIIMTGIQIEQNTFPSLAFERFQKKQFKARLVVDGSEKTTVGKDLSTLWTGLWGNYFNRSAAVEARTGLEQLVVTGWFAPDAVLEFDRVLRSWDTAVQDAKLIEMDMQPTGVGGVWEVKLLNAERLQVLLKSVLPQRGLSYRLMNVGDGVK